MALDHLSEDEYEDIARRLIEENGTAAKKAREGQKGKLMWLVGQMMRAGEGKIEPKRAEGVMRQMLGNSTADNV